MLDTTPALLDPMTEVTLQIEGGEALDLRRPYPGYAHFFLEMQFGTEAEVTLQLLLDGEVVDEFPFTILSPPTGRMYIEQFVMLPVTICTSASRVLYQIHDNARQPERMTRMACDNVNR